MIATESQDRLPPLNVDLNEAAQFIAALTGSEDTPVTWQTFDDQGQRKGLARVLHGPLKDQARSLVSLNDRGAGVYVCVNETDLRGRRTSNVTALRALFVDSDTGPLPELALEPDIHVRSLRGEHAYWLLTPGQPLARFGMGQSHLAAALGTDGTVKDLPRVMRVPGFLHRKAEPFLVTCEVLNHDRHTVDEVLAAFPIAAPLVPVRPPTTIPPPPADPMAVARALAYLGRRPGAIEGQGGDNFTYATACKLVLGFGLSDEDALAAMQHWNAKCEPPWEESALLLKIRHARMYGREAPGGMLAQGPRGTRNTDLEMPAWLDEADLPPVDEDPTASFFGRPIDPDARPPNWKLRNGTATRPPVADETLEMPPPLDEERPLDAANDEFEDEEARALPTVRSALPDAPVSVGARIPKDYELKAGHDWGITMLSIDGRKTKRVEGEAGPKPDKIWVAAYPIVIEERLVDAVDGHVYLKLAWRIGKTWRRQVVERDKVMAQKDLVALAAFDFPISTINNRPVVHYLAQYETLNRWAIPTRISSSQMGWVEASKHKVFLYGDQCLAASKKAPVVEFIGESPGDTHLAKCFRKKGTLEGWIEVMRQAAAFPKVELGIYAAMSTPLLDVLGVPNCALDWGGESSQGKTTALCLAASVWGCPDGRDRNSLIHSWNATQVGLERLASTLNGLPMLLDETKQAPKGRDGKSIVAPTVYQITNGHGRARGAKTGREQTRYWRTVMLTTGEQSIVNYSKDAGVAARVVTLWGSPFGGYSEAVPKIEAGMLANFGHMGPLFAQWVVNNRDSKEELWRHMHADMTVRFAKQLGQGGGFAARLARYLALFELTAQLVREAVALPWAYTSPIEALMGEVDAGSEAFDRPLEAAKLAYDVAVAEQTSFYGRHDANRPPIRFNGYWKPQGTAYSVDSDKDFDLLGFAPSFLTRVLEPAGFDVLPMVKAWAERGWLVRNNGSEHLTYKVKIAGTQTRVYALSRESIAEIIDV